MTEQVSGKLPLDKPASAAPSVPEADAVIQLGEAMQDAFRQVSAALQVLNAHLAALFEMEGRLGADLLKRIGDIDSGGK